MKTKFLQTFLFCLILGFTFSAQAGWKWTDMNSKIVAKTASKLENRIVNIYSFHKEDEALAKDASDDEVLKYQLQLSEAMSELLYMAQNSPNQKRFLKRVQKYAPKKFVKEMKRILKYIERSKWMDEPYINDLILEEADRIATSTIKKAQKVAAKRVKRMKVIASNNR